MNDVALRAAAYIHNRTFGHKAVLFMGKAPQFAPQVIDALWTPLESGTVRDLHLDTTEDARGPRAAARLMRRYGVCSATLDPARAGSRSGSQRVRSKAMVTHSSGQISNASTIVRSGGGTPG